MESLTLAAALASFLIWLAVLAAPWQPWRTREVMEADETGTDEDLSQVTAVIPARNEAAVIRSTLEALQRQGRGLRVLLIDDGSTDGTAQAAMESAIPLLKIVPGKPLPDGWIGKVWALEQGTLRVSTPLTLLLDADIGLRPGILAALLSKQRKEEIDFLSIMATPSLNGFWERLLMPAYVFFFKLLYPFALSNHSAMPVAAGAGGCVLLETSLIGRIGGLGCIKNAIIDDCALARAVKRAKARTWIGLSQGVHSVRPYGGFGAIWNMVARTAFTQLRYSIILLALCSMLMVLAFISPLITLFSQHPTARLVSLSATMMMVIAYIPILRYYRLSPVWAMFTPVIGLLYLSMTWASAIRFWKGIRSEWKGRAYEPSQGTADT